MLYLIKGGMMCSRQVEALLQTFMLQDAAHQLVRRPHVTPIQSLCALCGTAQHGRQAFRPLHIQSGGVGVKLLTLKQHPKLKQNTVRYISFKILRIFHLNIRKHSEDKMSFTYTVVLSKKGCSSITESQPQIINLS